MSNESGVAAVRFSRLDGTGQPISPGTNGGWTACDPISVETTFNYDTPNNVTKKDGLDRICFQRNKPAQLTGASAKATLCGVVKEEIELVINGPGTLIGGATPTGYALSTVSCGDASIAERGGVFMEWWVGNYQCSSQDTDNPWIRKWLARAWLNIEGGVDNADAKDIVFSGEVTASIVTPTGDTLGGPFNDLTALTAGSSYLFGTQDETDLPDCTNDYELLPADV